MDAKLRVGLVGLDSSHCLAFTRILQGWETEYNIPGVQLIGAYVGGSTAFALSRDRVKGFTEEIRVCYGIPVYENITDLAQEADAMMLLSSDGRQHLAQFRQMALGKPVFIDKPLATSTDDARRIIASAQRTGTPILSCSALRYATGIAEALPENFELASCEAFGPLPIYSDYPRLFWYGIHCAEMLFSLLGCGIREVQSIAHPGMDFILGEWSDGRLGVVRGMRSGSDSFGCLLHGQETVICRLVQDQPPPYYLLLQKVIAFLAGRISPVPVEEMFAVIAFLEAASKSSAERGRRVAVDIACSTASSD